VLGYADGPITFTTPDNITHLITADSSTAIISQNPTLQNLYCAGYYTRSQNVTNILNALTAGIDGTYTVGRVPSTVSAYENTGNSAGWTLAIIYHNPLSADVNNMAIFVGGQAGSYSGSPAEVSGFYVQIPGSARLLVSAVEADPNKNGDQMQFGPTPATLTPLSGANNPINNFFCSQINNDLGILNNYSGTFCTCNSSTSTLVANGRHGYDITNVDCSATILASQTKAYALGTTSGDNYVINALGIQISVYAPVVVPIKRVNDVLSYYGQLGETVTFTITMTNSGTEEADNVVFTDILESGLSFIPDSVYVNNIVQPGENPELGILLGTFNIDDTIEIKFDAQIVSPPPSGNEFENIGTISFDYTPPAADPIHATNETNPVTITLNSTFMPPPRTFTGIGEKCEFLNKTMYTLTASWAAPSLSTNTGYQIYKKGILQTTIPATGPFVYQTCLSSKQDGREMTIVALYPNGFTSAPLPIEVTYK